MHSQGNRCIISVAHPERDDSMKKALQTVRELQEMVGAIEVLVVKILLLGGVIYLLLNVLFK